MEDHKRGLNKHCRVCAKSMHKFKCKRRCSDYRDLLIEAYSIDCVNDDPEVHLAQFCPPCFQRAGRISDAKALSLLLFGQAILETAVTCVKCSVSSQLVEGPERRGKTVVTQGTKARTQSGNISIPSHPPVFKQYNHYIHHSFTQQHPTSLWLTFSVLAVQTF